MESAGGPDRAGGSEPEGQHRLTVGLLGPMRLSNRGVAVVLPGSRKVRGLLAYLLMARRPLHRSRLCEIFWDGPNDPRGELRWCLSKIRGVLDDRHARRVRADKDFVAIDLSGLDVDALALDRAAETALAGSDVPGLERLTGIIQGDFLDGFAAEQLPLFDAWLTAERERYRTLQTRLLSRIVELLPVASEQRFSTLRKLIELQPYDEAGHRDMLEAFAATGRFAEGDAHLALASRLLTSGGGHAGALEEGWRTTKVRRLSAAPLQDTDPSPKGIEVRASHRATGSSGGPAVLASLQPRDVPALKLPPHLTSYVGRGDEQDEVKARLSQSRLVTLVGAGGCGKTRLALNVARAFSGENAEPVWLVELAALGEQQLVGEVLCQSIGLPVSENGSAVDQASAYLKGRKALIVLDNCEHLIDTVASVATAVLGSCREVLILATSREMLNVPGESVYFVPGLGLPPATVPLTLDLARRHDAIRLFDERARAVAQDFALSDDNADAVGDICRQLDGLPLGIELVVPLLRMMQPQGLAARLQDRVVLNVKGERGVQPRHRTLEAMFDWSYNLLSGTERDVFCRLSVFNDGWSLAAATAVAGEGMPDGELSAVLGRLVDKSLVVTNLHDGAPRYGYLQTTRQYALTRLENNANTFRKRLTLYLAGLFEQADAAWPTTPTELWLAMVEPDLDNLRASLDWAFSLEGDDRLGVRLCAFSRRIWDELALLSERERWFALASARHDQNTPRSVVARLWLGRLSNSGHGDHGNFELARQAADLFQAAGEPQGLGEALAKAGAALERPESTADALPYLEEALRVLAPAGPTKPLAGCLRSLAIAHYFDRDFETARGVARAIGIDRKGGWRPPRRGDGADRHGRTRLCRRKHRRSDRGSQCDAGRQSLHASADGVGADQSCGLPAGLRSFGRRGACGAPGARRGAGARLASRHRPRGRAYRAHRGTRRRRRDGGQDVGIYSGVLRDRDRQPGAYGTRDVRASVDPPLPYPVAGPSGAADARGSTLAVRRSGPARADGRGPGSSRPGCSDGSLRPTVEPQAFDGLPEGAIWKR